MTPVSFTRPPRTRALPSLVRLLTLAGTLGGASVCTAQGTMYACASGRQFYSINLTTGAMTFLRNISAGVPISASLAYDCDSGITYVSSTGGNVGVQRKLYQLNVGTGAVTTVGDFGDPAMLMHGIEVNSWTGTLYAHSAHNGGLYTVNKTNGAATLVGFTGITGTGSFGQLGFDSDQGVMYVTDSITNSLYRLNLSTAATTLVGPMGTDTVSAMAYNIDNHTMYMIENSTTTAKLYTVNLTTGAATLVGNAGVANLIGLVYVTPTCPPPPPACPPDFDGDGFLTGDDFDAYVAAFEAGAISADFDDDGFVTGDDFDLYVAAFEAGC